MPRPKKQSEGLGDTVEKIIHFTGLQHFVNGDDCGCEERKKKLNELFPYRFKPVRCLTEQEYIEWGEFQKVRTLIILTGQQVTYVCDLYSSVFGKQKWYPCQGCVKEMIAMIDRLDKVYETYNK
jgi:hypothetical protein